MPKKVFEISWGSPDNPDWINEEDVRRVLACSYREEANFRVKEIRPTQSRADKATRHPKNCDCNQCLFPNVNPEDYTLCRSL